MSFLDLLQRSDDLLDFNIRNSEDKAYFKDLPSGNMNLFAYELIKNQSDDKKSKAFDFKELDEFLSFYGVDLDKELKAYDQESETILQNLKEAVDGASSFSKEFKEQLKSMGKLIYWRK